MDPTTLVFIAAVKFGLYAAPHPASAALLAGCVLALGASMVLGSLVWVRWLVAR